MTLLKDMSAKLDVLSQQESKGQEIQLSKAFLQKDEEGITGEQVLAAVTRMIEKDEAPSENMAADYITLLKSNMENMSDKNEKLKTKLDAVEKQLEELGAEAAGSSGSSEELEQMRASTRMYWRQWKVSNRDQQSRRRRCKNCTKTSKVSKRTSIHVVRRLPL